MYTKSKGQLLSLEKNVMKSYVMREKYCTGVTKSPPIQFCQSLLKRDHLGVVFILMFWQFLGILVGRDRMYQFCTHPVRTSLCKMVSTGYMIKT